MLVEPFRPIPKEALASTDYYIANPPRQPKREIADYVGGCGVPVPLRFSTLDEAFSSGKSFVMRNEHPQDYNGASDIGRTFLIDPGDVPAMRKKYGTNINWEKFSKNESDLNLWFHTVRAAISQIGLVAQDEFEDNLFKFSSRDVGRYCHFAGIDLSTFQADHSYSYWQALPGFNRAIVADSAIQGRYHIFTVIHDLHEGLMGRKGFGYSMVENGEVMAGKNWELPPEAEADFQSLIEFYESVRNLGRFDKNHCPIIEAQTVDNTHYFLQYHKTVDFNKPTFSLDRPLEEGEVEAFMVRGATPPEGFTVNLGVHFRNVVSDGEEGALDYVKLPYFLEAFIRQRKLQIIQLVNQNYLASFAGGHVPRSELLKAGVSAVLLKEPSYILLEEARSRRSRENPAPQARVRIVSDGRKAYLRTI